MDQLPKPGRRAVVFDMEWNQPLPWKQYPHVPKALMPGEIIDEDALAAFEKYGIGEVSVLL